MNQLGATGVVVMTYHQDSYADNTIYSLDDDKGDLWNVEVLRFLQVDYDSSGFDFKRGRATDCGDHRAVSQHNGNDQ